MQYKTLNQIPNNMLKTILSVCALITSLHAFGQSYHIIRLDSAKWRIEQRTMDAKGSGSVIYSDTADSVTTIQKYAVMVEQRKKAIDERVYEKQYQAMNDELFRASGKRYEDMVRDAVQGYLVGNWELITGNDTLALVITRDMRIQGGQIRGEVKYSSPEKIEIVGVMPKPQTVSFISPTQLKGPEVVMRKV